MSNTSQGPGWWMASDGKWYPPETWTGPPLPTAQPAGSPLPQPTGYPSGTGPTPGYPSFQGAPMAAAPTTNGMAVASLVCSCAGIVPFFFGIPCVLGIIFGFVARGQIRRTNGTQGGRGMALAGIIVGFALIGIFVIIVIVLANTHTVCSSTTSSCTTN